MKYTKKTLLNGLTIIEVPSSDAESVVVDFLIKTGSRSETKKESGISHFLEHFLFKGSKKYPSALAISSLIDSIGGEMNASTGKEQTQFYIKAASKYLPLIFEVLTDMVKNPLLDKTELEKEKGVIIEEINMYKDTPIFEVENVLERTMWPNEPLGRDVAGTRETVAKFNRQMFESYISRHYQTPNIILGVSGKYESAKLNQLIRKYWEAPKRTALLKEGRPLWSPVRDGQKSPRLKIEYKKTEQAHMVLGFKGFSFTDKRSIAATVLSAVLGGGMSSRLFTEVREKRGLAYYIRASDASFRDTGMFTVSSGVQVGKIEQAIKIILDELKKIKTQKIGDKELKKAKEYIKGKSTLALEDNQVRLDWFLERCAFFPTIETPAEVFKQIDAITSSDIQKVAKDLFQNKNMTLAVIGPYKNEKRFKKLFKI